MGGANITLVSFRTERGNPALNERIHKPARALQLSRTVSVLPLRSRRTYSLVANNRQRKLCWKVKF